MTTRNHENAIILSDLRAVPVATVVDLLLKEGGDLYIAKACLERRDFGDAVSAFQKWAVVLIMRHVARLVIIPTFVQSTRRKRYHGFQSSLISITNSRLASEVEFPELSRSLRDLEDGALSVVERLRPAGYRKIFLFNGRTASTQPIAKELSNSGETEVMIYEWGGATRCTYLKVAHPRHDMVAESRRILDWAAARRFHYDAREAKAFREKKLTNTFKLVQKRNVSERYATLIFAGSPHEHAVVDVPNLSTLDSNLTSLVSRALATGRIIRPAALRLHPNMSKDPSLGQQLADLVAFLGPLGIDLIPPSDRTSAFELVRDAQIVIVGNSSVGLDSIFYGKWPVIIGHPPYKDLVEEVKEKFPSDYQERIAGLLGRYDKEGAEKFGSTAKAVWLLLRLVEIATVTITPRNRFKDSK